MSNPAFLRSRERDPSSSGIYLLTAYMANMPKGTLTRKTHRHERKPVMMPPAGAPTANTESRPRGRNAECPPRDLVGQESGYDCEAMAVSMAQPIPWMNRESMSISSDRATPQRSDPMVKRR